MSCIQKQSKNILTPTRPKSHRNPTTNLQQYSTPFRASRALPDESIDSQDATETLEKANERHREVTAMVKAPACGCALLILLKQA